MFVWVCVRIKPCTHKSSRKSLFLSLFLVFLLRFAANHPNDQASRPLEVGFCDGNHGPRQPLCLQHSHRRRWLDEWPRGANLGRPGYHWNGPQSFSGHFCLYLHFCHLRSPTVGEGSSFLAISGLRRFLQVWAIRKSELQPVRTALAYRYFWKIYAHIGRDGASSYGTGWTVSINWTALLCDRLCLGVWSYLCCVVYHSRNFGVSFGGLEFVACIRDQNPWMHLNDKAISIVIHIYRSL